MNIKNNEIQIITNSKEDTILLARKIAKYLRPKDVVTLDGDLGAGKTTFVSGILRYFNYKEKVISPTFNILKCYFEVQPPIFHIDAYRLEDNYSDIGLDEYIEGEGICFIEWSKYIHYLIPKNHININIKIIDDSTRQFSISFCDDRVEEFIKELE